MHTPDPSSGAKTPTVITIHGLGRLAWSMYHFTWLCSKYGFNCFHFSYRCRQGSIQDHAEKLAETIKNSFDPATPLYFVCHSLGSVILLKAAGLLKDYNIQRAVFLGPPLRGSTVAKKLLSVGFLKRYLGPPFEELASLEPLPMPSFPVGVIAGYLSRRWSLSPWFSKENDFLVSIDETKVDGIDQHRIIRCPHAVLMYSPTILKEVFNYFLHGRFQTAS